MGIKEENANRAVFFAAISLILATISLISTISAIFTLNLDNVTFEFLYVFSPLITLATFVVAILALFHKKANSKTRRLCVSAIILIIISILIYIGINSIGGIV